MGSKHKKPGTASLAPETSTDDRSVSGRVSGAPRRSGRLSDRERQASGSQPAEHLRIVMQAQQGQAEVEIGRPMGEESADEALSGLQEMEDRLRKDVKRQKRAVKESEVQSNGLEKEYAALIPRPIKSLPNVLPAKDDIKGMKKDSDRRAQHVEDARPDGKEEGQQLLDNDDGGFFFDENDTSIPKQDEARPPPVNSDYLPLPWKGRLGYVNHCRQW
jgi:hypothetical protein